MIPVTKSYLPPIQDYMKHVQRAYNNGWLTNRGELVVELEHKITEFLKLENSKILCMNNGTSPLLIALKLLGNEGEVITTPFSYVATTSSIVWENCTPVFVDIHPDYLTIDETKIEDAITPKTTCIIATHVFGNPCNIDAINQIAQKHNLKVIYDAAHCFGVKYKGRSIFEYGDVSTCSFHATKLFHTGEGGAVFCKNSDLFHKLFFSHNFGHKDNISFHGLGINAKISELQAAMGLAVLPNITKLISQRESIIRQYKNLLNTSNILHFKIRVQTTWNYSYFPVIFKNEEILRKVERNLNQKNIFPRRYFYPSLNTLKYLNVKSSCITSENTSKTILCLPIYSGLSSEEIKLICDLVNSSSS